ncbi:hypothetical protein DL546_008129 [Coniochaeta pulveracea]|uniref:Fanconi-associated nuclease n=1 Tax=Coniochaeta pulveracea TaxID=177199 RepID=A0A420YEX4_9PEZI|nr:hypothetical protein DL546_008129 [Coniochaeta pulveracea]
MKRMERQFQAPLAAASTNAPIIKRGDGEPSPKRRRVVREEKIKDEIDEDKSDLPPVSEKARGKRRLTVDDADDDEEPTEPFCAQHETAFESSLPDAKTGKDAIEEYEALLSSQPEEEDSIASRLDQRKWVRGKSSIYVDAFNLALDTVLEDESHLFDEKERKVFEEWRGLDYEAQYLYVRLFLRKAASWHRRSRLGYHSDIADIDRAVEALLESRQLPASAGTEETGDGGTTPQEWFLGSTFSFVDDSDHFIDNMEEAVPLLSLDELKAVAKEAKINGKNKGEMTKALCRMSSRQAGLLSFGLRRESTSGSVEARDSPRGSRSATPTVPSLKHEDSNRDTHFLYKILATTGPLIRLSDATFKLFERVHLVFYRSTEWTEKSLTTIILAKISRRNFPSYIVDRSTTFSSRRHLLKFERSIRAERAVDDILEFNGPPGKAGLEKVLEIFESISSRWREVLTEEQAKEDSVYEFGEGAYLRRFTAAHAYTRIAHKAAYVLGRLHEYNREHELLSELLLQRLFHPARRGSWYTRKALLEEHYMWKPPEEDGDDDDGTDSSSKKKSKAKVKPKSKSKTSRLPAEVEKGKRHWTRIAANTCEAALQDPDTHLIYHYDLQKRLVKLEQRLNIPKRQQHDFGHVRLRAPEEHTVSGIQLIRESSSTLKPGTAGGPSTKTIWLDELGDDPEAEVSVEEMCLSHYRSQGWKGYHAEGGILRTLFAYLFYDVLFLYVPNVFQTAFQTCPLDLHSDGFYPARASEINHRLVEIENGAAERIIRTVDEKERERRTCVVGLNWDFELEDLVELVNCFEGSALAAVCKVMCQEYKSRGGGVPDLVLWRTGRREDGDGAEEGKDGGEPEKDKGEVMFAEVKSANDRLSDTQRLWIHVLTGAGVRVALCNAVAKEVRPVE